MVKLLNLDRTATFALSSHNLPLLATADVAGTFDASFLASSKLEIWNPFRPKSPLHTTPLDGKLMDLAWSPDNALLAGGLESGGLIFLDSNAKPLHTLNPQLAPLKTLAFNPLKPNLLLSGSGAGEILLWDTTNLLALLSPLVLSPPSKTPEDVTLLAWNHKVPHIFALATSSGVAAVWDLKNKRKVLSLLHTAATASGNVRANLSCVTWDPHQLTKLVTGLDLDLLPGLFQWDLRYAKLPELVYGGLEGNMPGADVGHSKGVISVDWHVRDPGLLISSGKDANTFLWDAKSGKKLASYPAHAKTSTINAIGANPASEWVFKTRFSNNPDFFASATFGGKVFFQSLQDTSANDAPEVEAKPEVKETSETDFWKLVLDQPEPEEEKPEEARPEIFVLRAPEWLYRPASGVFGYGGKFVHIADNDVKILTYKPENVESVDGLKAVLDNDEDKIKEAVEKYEGFDWDLIRKLKGSKEDLLKEFLGGKKEDKKEIAENADEPEKEALKTEKEAEGEDFFATLLEDAQNGVSIENSEKNAPETEAKTSFFAPSGEFLLFSSSDSETATLLKRQLLEGDFAGAVSIALEADMPLEALIIAVSLKQDELRNKVLGSYFESKITKDKDTLARLLYAVSGIPSTTTGSSTGSSSSTIDDLVSNASVSNWKEIAQGILSYVLDSSERSQKLASLGDRVLASGDRNNAVLLYFVGGLLGKLAQIWLDELKKQEKSLIESKSDEEKHSLPLDLYYTLLAELLAKIFIFKRALSIEGELPSSEQYSGLIKLVLDYATHAAEVHDTLFVPALLAALPADNPDVRLARERAGDRKVAKPATVNAATSAKKYSQAPVVAPWETVTPVAQPKKTRKYVAPTTAASVPTVAPVQTAYPAYPQAQRYAPPPAASPVQTTPVPGSPAFGPSFINTSPAPSASRSSLQNPLRAKKQGHEGWNDLPDNFLVKGTKKRAAPVTVAQPLNATVPPPPQSPSVTGGPYGRNVIPGPPPKLGTALPKVLSAPLTPNRFGANSPAPVAPSPYVPTAPPLSTPNPYAPSAPTPSAPGVSAPNPYAPSASQNAPNPYAPSTPAGAPSGKYAPAGGNLNSPMTGPPVGSNGLGYAPPNGFTPSVPAASPYGNSYTPGAVPGAVPGAGAAAIPPPPKSIKKSGVSAPSTSNALPGPPTSSLKAKHPAGDRSHIPENAQNVYRILSSELAAVKPKVPEKHAKKVQDTEKRLNILFDHLNNGDLVTTLTIAVLNQLAECLAKKDFAGAQALYLQLSTQRAGEMGQWGSGVKRLIGLVEAGL